MFQGSQKLSLVHHTADALLADDPVFGISGELGEIKKLDGRTGCFCLAAKSLSSLQAGPSAQTTA